MIGGGAWRGRARGRVQGRPAGSTRRARRRPGRERVGAAAAATPGRASLPAGSHGRAKGGDQERGHVGGDAAGLGRVCHAGAGEVQHREGHRRAHQEGEPRVTAPPAGGAGQGERSWARR